MSFAYQFTDGWICDHLNGHLLTGGPNDKDAKKKWKPFQPEGTPARYTRDRVVDVKHIRVDVRLDVKGKSIRGHTTLTVAPIADEVKTLELDAVELDVSTVTVEGRMIGYDNTGEKLILHFDKPLKAASEIPIEIAYRATPRRGLYFIAPDKNYPRKRTEVWSQGEDEDNRHWFPCFDYPNEKATSELIATVPGKWFCLSNGELVVKRKNSDGTATFHWRQDVPHVSYLITLCAGEYAEVRDEWDGIPVNYYVPPGREADGKRSFGRTPEMVGFYSDLIGVRYPFAKYAQITATDFIFGGMENTSATTQTERTLHDARAHLDFSSEPLVAHELVHSWFGNLVTCRDWSHAWLNESFATYFDNLWYRHSRGEDEFRYELYGDMRAYLDEDTSHYRRPIVTNVYREPIDLFDRHLYQKGACLLNFLRNHLGDRLFFKAVKLYVERFRERTAVTQDLLNAFEDATGRNFEWLFDQFVFKGGHPEFEVSCAWDDKTSVASLTIAQKQTPDEMTVIFRLPVKVRFVGEGYDQTREFAVGDAKHAFHITLPARPKWIAFDPANTIPKTVDLKFDADQLAAQLTADDDVMGRVYAAQALGKKGSAEALKALKLALVKDLFWGVQAEAAEALSKMHTSEALDALIEARRVRHPKARRAVAKALGAWREKQAAKALLPMLQRDESCFVEATAAESLGRTRVPQAFPALKQALKKNSWMDTIRGGVLRGLVESDPVKALPLVEAWARPGVSEPTRMAALPLWGRAARESEKDEAKKRARLALEKVLHDGFFTDRMAALGGLEQLRDRAALPTLEALKDAALDGRIKRRIEETAAGLREAGGIPPEVKSLREELDKLKDETEKLKEQVQKLEAAKPGKGGAKRKAKRK
jgi:aminopeptidase N